MQYQLNQPVRNLTSGEAGVIKGRSEYAEGYGLPQYWVHFKDAQGRATKDWWVESEIDEVAA